MSRVTRSARVADNFALIANGALRDKRLSFRARGLMAYLLSLPPNWRTTVRQLAIQTTEGRDAVATAINELVEYGYVTRTDRREGGKYKGVDYFVTDDPAVGVESALPPDEPDDEDPEVPPRPENPDTESPRPGNPDPVLPDTVQPDPADQPLQRKRTTNTGRTKTDPRRAAAQDRGDKPESSPSVTREPRSNREVSAVEGTRSARPDGPGRVAFERAVREKGIALKALSEPGALS